jgi:hypothetical protein
MPNFPLSAFSFAFVSPACCISKITAFLFWIEFKSKKDLTPEQENDLAELKGKQQEDISFSVAAGH